MAYCQNGDNRLRVNLNMDEYQWSDTKEREQIKNNQQSLRTYRTVSKGLTYMQFEFQEEKKQKCSRKSTQRYAGRAQRRCGLGSRPLQ